MASENKDISFRLRKDFEIDGVKLINFVNLSEDEKRMVLKWRNSRRVRKWMFNSEPISESEHFSFIERLKMDNRNFYWVAEIDGTPTGVVYFQKVDVINKSSYLGIYSVRKGNGKLMLGNLMRLWFDVLKMCFLKCEVLEGNERAFRLYKDLGFEVDNSSAHTIIREGETVKVISLKVERHNYEVHYAKAY